MEEMNYVQVVPLTDDEKREIYMQKPKEELIEMMLEQERVIDELVEKRDFYYSFYLDVVQGKF